MEKTDLREFSDDELSLIFANDEDLYKAMNRAHSFEEVKQLADELYIYNDEQLAELQNDFNEAD